MKSSLCYSADFETTTDKNDCRVWAYALSNVENPDEFYYGNSIEGFMKFCSNPKYNYTMYFFNLKFDGAFILSWLLKEGYTRVDSAKDRQTKTFTTLITEQGAFYVIEIYFEVKGKHSNKVKILDAMKLFPNFSVESLAEGFGLEISKLELDYKEARPVGHELTPHEIAYIRNDVEIVARVLKFMFDKGLTKMTIASNAISDFKKRCPNFKQFFPHLSLTVDETIRKSYRGGFTYLNEKYIGKDLKNGICLDVNSLYPSCQKMTMPVGEPQFFEGKYQLDNVYSLYVQVISCRFELKPNKIPCIQIKHTLSFIDNEYLKSSNGETVTLTLTKPDLELFLDQYEIADETYIGGWKFRPAEHIFDSYIDYWMKEKIEATKEGSKPRRAIAKLLLNSCYGRFAISLTARQKAPILDHEGNLHYINLPEEETKGLYIPVASFITAYGRNKTIRTSQAVRDYSLKKYKKDLYWYSDTDSIWCGLSKADLEELKDIIEIDDYKLGAWALEKTATRFKGLRQKCYIYETEDKKVHVTVAGLPHYLAPLITFDNFKKGFSTAGLTIDKMKEIAKKNGATEDEIKKIHHKLRYTYVSGGVILEDTDFTIK